MVSLSEKGHDSQEAALQLIHRAPKPITILLSRLDANGRFKDSNTRLLCQIRPLTHNLFFEIRSEFVIGHLHRLSKEMTRNKVRKKSSSRRDTETSTRDACATQTTRDARTTRSFHSIGQQLRDSLKR